MVVLLLFSSKKKIVVVNAFVQGGPDCVNGAICGHAIVWDHHGDVPIRKIVVDEVPLFHVLMFAGMGEYGGDKGCVGHVVLRKQGANVLPLR